MMLQDNDKLLHLQTKHTNLTTPYSDYVKADTFPEQITELLNTEVTLKYRNHYISDYTIIERAAVITVDGESVSSRPSDDTQQLKPIVLPDTERKETPFVSEGKFRVIRADKTSPYRLIAISDDYRIIAVNTTEKDTDGNYLFNTIVSDYPTQMNEYVGLDCYDQYVASTTELEAVTLRVDATENMYSVLMEYVDKDNNVVRFIIGDEAFSKIRESNTATLTDLGIYEFRKSALEGKTIYGTV